MKRLWRRHRCPPCVSLEIMVNGQVVVGPVTGEDLAYIVRYSSAGADELDLLDPELAGMTGQIDSIKVIAKRI